ncbi:hypothetical protein UAO_02181 [Enterococcus villorum ATCC 700913]|uniref:Uncharacterized protein n=1 Tax=Enterococcus villorum ATCC 700913 TaxID=1158604 RepID=A0ABN0KEJ1_9ENTE|nr:hypothetical protein UAO_02181 [Enterococcus villorum ATCC 700913]EOW77811.1 hypothetical protein I591_00665 [Enterococcus villorum ATCC 700913]
MKEIEMKHFGLAKKLTKKPLFTFFANNGFFSYMLS